MKSRLVQAMMIAAAAAAVTGCGSDDDDDNNNIPATREISFAGVAAPATDAEKRAIFASTATVEDKTYGGEYRTFLRSGEVQDGKQFGQLIDKAGTVLKAEDGSVRISDSNEFTSILPVGKKLFSVSQFEDRPGAMFLMELNQDDNGVLSVKSLEQIDQSGVDGGWVHCAGSVTPWTTHLASEEYEPDASVQITGADAAENGYSAPMLDYYADISEWNPYYYGWNIEIAVDEAADVTSTKHYAMGRLAYELSYVMPDQKTVYMTDDGTNVGLYMFVADNAGDLTAGTTYAAVWKQTSAAGAGEAKLEWVSLGHATNAAMKDYVHGTNGKPKVKFADIFDAVEPESNVCPVGYTSINAGGNGQECLKVKAGMETVASRFETRRYAAMMGATTEFRKEEGVTFDSKRNKLYIAMSSVERGMEDFKKNGSAKNSYDIGGPNHIRLDSYNKCGTVYELDLFSVPSMGSQYVATTMKGLVSGRPVSEQDPQVAGFEDNNSCHIDGIANPDNVTYMSGYDKLIIGEDTGSGHQNDVIWAYDFEDKSLTRIQTTPYGAETTSPYWYPNINGWAYLTSVVQHPYGESDSDKDTGAGEARAYTGYIGPFPAVKQ
ncbi:hypothetical protein CHH28_01180 [Bacterioplanes sanyensis]|uniref:Alkaline phosphatase n=2 Tax=Bacterioplanes sanyensis TaxID=1249553 RepID=A0A222FRD8_9GAMM|nr:hypothetical protein CHH28_01180 [Bacterioplanes sanyensis]